MTSLAWRERESALMLARVSCGDAGITALPGIRLFSSTVLGRLFYVSRQATGGHDGQEDDQNSIQLRKVDDRCDVLTSLSSYIT